MGPEYVHNFYITDVTGKVLMGGVIKVVVAQRGWSGTGGVWEAGNISVITKLMQKVRQKD